MRALRFLYCVGFLVACGSTSETATQAESEQAESEQAESEQAAEQPSQQEGAASEETTGEADLAEALAPPPPEDSPAEPPAIPTGAPVGVVMGEVAETPDAGDAQLRVASASNGLISVQALGLTGHCGASPSFFARLEGNEVRLYAAPATAQARCMTKYSVNLHLGPLADGDYSVVMANSTAEVHVEDGASAHGLSGTQLATQTVAKETTETAGVSQPRLDPATGLTHVRVTLPKPCTDSPLTFAASLENNQLVLEMQTPIRVGRCAAILRTFDVLVETSDLPTEVVLSGVE